MHRWSVCICFRCIIQVCRCQTSNSQHSWCPYDCPTPYPHSLTCISLLVTPQQIRKASQHLHGDRPQSSRWPQCATRQLKRKRRAGKWKWVRIRGSRAGNVKLPLPQACAQTCALAHTHVHASMHLSCKNKYPAHANHKASAVWEGKEGLVQKGKRSPQQTAPESHTPNLSNSEKLENLPPEWHGQIPQPNR